MAQYVDVNGLEFNCSVDGAVITCPSTFTYNFESLKDENGETVVDEEGNPREAYHSAWLVIGVFLPVKNRVAAS